jgi:hypothetical protein
VTGEWRKLHNEELHNLYSSPDIIRQIKANEVGGACSTHGRGEKSVLGFGGKARRRERPFGRPRSRWEDGVRTDLREIGLGGCGLDSTVSGQGPVAGCCECGDELCATGLVS